MRHDNIIIMFICDCHIDGDIFNPIGILLYRYGVLPKDDMISQYLF